jgi:hypothetical protein
VNDPGEMRALTRFGQKYPNAHALLEQWRCARVLLALQGCIDIKDPISKAPYSAWAAPKTMHGGGIEQTTALLPAPDARSICALSRNAPVCVYEPKHGWPLISRALGIEPPPPHITPQDFAAIHRLEDAAIEDAANMLLTMGTPRVVSELQDKLDCTPNEARILVSLALKRTEHSVPDPIALRSAVIARLEAAFTEAVEQGDLGAQGRLLKLMLQSSPQLLVPGQSSSMFAKLAQEWDDEAPAHRDPLALDMEDGDGF